MTDNRLRLVAGCATALGGVVGLLWGIALVVPTGAATDAGRSTSTSSGSGLETVIFIAASTVFFAVIVGTAASLMYMAIRRLRHR